MAKIGRNQACPCGSGRKYKHCCLAQVQAGTPVSPMEQIRISLLGEIEKIQTTAADKKKKFHELGVFIFFSDENGDAWVLEVTESDAVQVAKNGESIAIELDENPDTIEINWSHTYTLRDKRFFLKAYADKKETELVNAPAKQIKAAIKRMYKRYPSEVLNQVHMESDAAAESEAA
jgi:hypothetical protein